MGKGDFGSLSKGNNLWVKETVFELQRQSVSQDENLCDRETV